MDYKTPKIKIDSKLMDYDISKINLDSRQEEIKIGVNPGFKMKYNISIINIDAEEFEQMIFRKDEEEENG